MKTVWSRETHGTQNPQVLHVCHPTAAILSLRVFNAFPKYPVETLFGNFVACWSSREVSDGAQS